MGAGEAPEVDVEGRSSRPHRRTRPGASRPAASRTAMQVIEVIAQGRSRRSRPGRPAPPRRRRSRASACGPDGRRSSAWRRIRRARARRRAACRRGCRAHASGSVTRTKTAHSPGPRPRAAFERPSTASKAARAALETSGKRHHAAAITAPCQVKIRVMPNLRSQWPIGPRGRRARAGSSRARSAAAPSAA